MECEFANSLPDESKLSHEAELWCSHQCYVEKGADYITTSNNLAASYSDTDQIPFFGSSHESKLWRPQRCCCHEGEKE